MEQIISNKFELITLCSGLLILMASCFYILINHNQKTVIIHAFLNVVGILMIVASLFKFQNIQILWLAMISVLAFIIIWTAIAHLYYRKGEKLED